MNNSFGIKPFDLSKLSHPVCVYYYIRSHDCKCVFIKKIKYFIYARKSSESEDRQMASIDDQINELNKLAKENNLATEVNFP